MNNVVLFDGVCNLCNKSVDFVLRNEKGNNLKFASLQSDIGIQIIKDASILPQPDSFIFYADGTLFTKSSAAIEISKYLKTPWSSLGWMLKVIPRFIRDRIYGWVAKNRYYWFGKSDSCRVPTENEKKKFLD